MQIPFLVPAVLLFLLLAVAGSSGAAGEQPPASKDAAAEDELKPGEWRMEFGLDNQLFPSAIITLSTVKPEAIGIKPDPDAIGSPLGMAAILLRPQAAGDKVVVEISSTKLIRPSRLEATLADPGKTYELRPQLLYEYERMLAVRQPYPEDVTARVTLNGKPLGEKTQTVVVRPINDCFFGVSGDTDEDSEDWSEMFAAYVNENHPVVETILGEALRQKYVEQFAGYQGSAEEVQQELQAIWRVLQERGVKYSDISTTAVEGKTVHAQHVRLVGESAGGAQANCVDGSVLMASVFRKLGLSAYLVLLPSHMMVAVALDAEGKQVVPIETTMLSSATLEEAVASAQETIENTKKKDADDLNLISVNEAREAGILPLREVKK